MVFRLRPYDARFGDLLVELAGQVVTGAQLLAEVLGGDLPTREATAHKLQETDQAAEATAHAVLRALSAAFVTPFDRADVFRVTWAIRTCTARMDAAADEIVGFRLGSLPAGANELVQVVGRAADVTADAVPRLARPRTLNDPWIELIRLAKQGGQAHRTLLADIALTTVDPSALIRLTCVANSLRQAVDSFESVAHALQTVAVKEG